MESYQKELARVKEVLRANPKGVTITDISKKINVNRNSVAKYLDILQISGHAEMRSFGPAKVYFLSQRVPISTMLNLSTDHIVVLDRDLKIVHTNDNFLNFTNVEREVLLGKGIEESPLPIFASKKIIPKIKEALDGKDSTMEISFQMGERKFYFRIKLIPTTFDDGRQGVTILLEDITERKKAEMQLKSLFEASRLINSTVDINKIFKFISDSVQQLVGFDNLILFLVSEDKRSIYPTYASEGIRKKVENLILNYGEGLVGHCIENKEILLLNNAHDDKRGKKIPGLTEVFVSQIVVPLIIEDKCVGALHISKVMLNAYDQKDVDVLKPLSEVISSALRNFWLYNQLRKLDVELEEKII